MSHTLGPWDMRIQDAGIHTTLRDSTGVKFAVIIQEPRTVEKYANAYLISAAPDMLEALEFVVTQFGNYEDSEAIDMAFTAIAKTKGETE